MPLVIFCKSGSVPEFFTCTDKLQSWNKPRGRKVDIIPVEQLCARRSELSNKTHKSVAYDPRPERFWEVLPSSVEQLRYDLLKTHALIKSCALLTILVPSVQSIQHDHTYAIPDGDTQEMSPRPKELNDYSESDTNQHRYELQVLVQNLFLTSVQRASLEASTRQQSGDVWYEARRYRITGSKCGKILNQISISKTFCICTKTDYLESQNEPIARRAYVGYMRTHGHSNLSAFACGLYVHSEKGWLGASPDARVCDPDSSDPNGIAELKCQFSKADVFVIFYCYIIIHKQITCRLDRFVSSYYIIL